MNITEREFKSLNTIERDAIIFKNIEAISKKQRSIEINQIIQYTYLVILTVIVYKLW